jgi:hypothetical protein
MKTRHSMWTLITLTCLMLMLQAPPDLIAQSTGAADQGADVDNESKETAVYCANLVYATDKTSVCFSDEFLTQVRDETNILTHPKFDEIRLDSAELFDYPFAVMTGEGTFTLTEDQLANLRDYLSGGGFMIASAGCSSETWNTSFKQTIHDVFPDAQTIKLEADHPVYHSVYDIESSRYKSGGPKLPHLEALEIDGRVVMIWSPDGLNDTTNAGPDCCCCGGNEVKSARKLNVNILAYALTH